MKAVGRGIEARPRLHLLMDRALSNILGLLGGMEDLHRCAEKVGRVKERLRGFKEGSLAIGFLDHLKVRGLSDARDLVGVHLISFHSPPNGVRMAWEHTLWEVLKGLERTLSSRVLHKGRAFSFRRDEVELLSGRRTFRDFVEHPGAVAIIPILSDGRVVLVRQYRYPIGKELLEIPAGTLEEGESPIDWARRELREETGYEADSIEELLKCYLAPGYSSELIHIFVARGLREVGGRMEPDEDIRVEKLRFDELLKMIGENIIEDAKTICVILAFERFRGSIQA